MISRTSLPSDTLVIQFKYYHIENTLLSVDYIRCLDSQIIPYNDGDDDDQNARPDDVLNHEYRDELSLDHSAYDGHSTHCIPNCHDVSPAKDMCALRLFVRFSRYNV